jgi:hypothetical protein
MDWARWRMPEPSLAERCAGRRSRLSCGIYAEKGRKRWKTMEGNFRVHPAKSLTFSRFIFSLFVKPFVGILLQTNSNAIRRNQLVNRLQDFAELKERPLPERP